MTVDVVEADVVGVTDRTMLIARRHGEVSSGVCTELVRHPSLVFLTNLRSAKFCAHAREVVPQAFGKSSQDDNFECVGIDTGDMGRDMSDQRRCRLSDRE